MSYLGAYCLVSQKATPGRVTEIIYYLGKWGEVITSERGGCERKSPTSSRLFYRELAKVGKKFSRIRRSRAMRSLIVLSSVGRE